MNYLQRAALYAGVIIATLTNPCSLAPVIDGYRVKRTEDETTFVETSSTKQGIWPSVLIDQGNDGTLDLKCTLIEDLTRGLFCHQDITERERQAVKAISGRL